MSSMNHFAILQFCRAYMNALDNLAIRFSDVRVLAQMCMVPGVHIPAQLAMQLNVSRAMISANLTSLVKAGMILRVPSPDDGRSVVLMPTKLGMKTFQQINKNIQGVQDKLGQKMGQKKVDDLIKLIVQANGVLA